MSPRLTMNRRQFTRISATLAAGFMCPPALLRAQGTRSSALTGHDRDVQTLLGKMTLEEKIGQMVQAEHSAVKDIGDVDRYFLGSVLAGGNADPKNGNSLVDWTDMYDAFQSRALKTRLAVPLLFGVDAVHGHNNVIGAVVFPHNIGLGCTRNPKLIEAAARVTAEEVRATGINWNFAPCVAVPRDKRWGRTYEGFGESPELVNELGIAAVRGFQGSSLSDARSVVACAKHFAGDGGTEFGTGGVPKQGGGRHPLDQGDTKLSEADLRKLHMPRIHRCDWRRRRNDHAVLQLLERPESLRQQAPVDRNPQTGNEVRWLPDLRLQRRRSAARRLQSPDRAGHECGDGHVHGAREVPRAVRAPAGSRQVGRAFRCRASTMR